jgi:hypothetical protein
MQRCIRSYDLRIVFAVFPRDKDWGSDAKAQVMTVENLSKELDGLSRGQDK